MIKNNNKVSTKMSPSLGEKLYKVHPTGIFVKNWHPILYFIIFGFVGGCEKIFCSVELFFILL